MTKSFVAIEQKMCPICGVVHSHDCGLLLDKRLKESMDSHVTTGYGLCEEHDRLFKEGYIALVGVSNNPNSTQQTLTQETANRTGSLCHIRKAVFQQMFGLPEEATNLPMVFVQEAVIDMLKEKQKEAEDHEC